jgi:hypothetical protein
MVAMGRGSAAVEREAMLGASRLWAFALRVEAESIALMTRRVWLRWLMLVPRALPARARGRAIAWENFDPAKLGAALLAETNRVRLGMDDSLKGNTASSVINGSFGSLVSGRHVGR